MTQEELEIKYLNKWVRIEGYEIEREVFEGGDLKRKIMWDDGIIEGVIKYIDLYEDVDWADNTMKFTYIELTLLIPYQETANLITYPDNIDIDIIKTLKRKMQYKRSKKHAGLSK